MLIECLVHAHYVCTLGIKNTGMTETNTVFVPMDLT